jgi:lysophospholipase L1-like esterase
VEVAVGRLVGFVVSLALLIGVVSAPVAPLELYEASRDTPLSRVAVIGDSYTTGSDEGGQGANGWADRAWQMLALQGFDITPDVAAEGGAGYGIRGNRGSVFWDLTPRAVRPEDAVVVFFGSRNDQGVDPRLVAGAARDCFAFARRTALSARLLVIGPPWPTADVPVPVLQIRDVLYAEARAAGATWIDPIAERWFVGRPDLIGKDGVHPNDAGHAYMADKIAPLIAAQLPRRL